MRSTLEPPGRRSIMRRRAHISHAGLRAPGAVLRLVSLRRGGAKTRRAQISYPDCCVLTDKLHLALPRRSGAIEERAHISVPRSKP